MRSQSQSRAAHVSNMGLFKMKKEGLERCLSTSQPPRTLVSGGLMPSSFLCGHEAYRQKSRPIPILIKWEREESTNQQRAPVLILCQEATSFFSCFLCWHRPVIPAPWETKASLGNLSKPGVSVGRLENCVAIEPSSLYRP